MIAEILPIIHIVLSNINGKNYCSTILGKSIYWKILDSHSILRGVIAPSTLQYKAPTDCWKVTKTDWEVSLQWRHNGRDSVSNHQHHDCLLNRLFRRRSKKTSKLRVIGLCVGNSPGTGEFSAQMASYAENVSIWWRHHVTEGQQQKLCVQCKNTEVMNKLHLKSISDVKH